ncbi:hypothetical protein NEOLEDRAFT_1043165, partial [Neolentinus lepideus HHB14362 ss-1]
LAYAAFYGDVEHKVTPVKSGYHVTLTYNLYLPNDVTLDATVSVLRESTEGELREILQELLDDLTFLPKEGSLGFSLKYQYPV